MQNNLMSRKEELEKKNEQYIKLKYENTLKLEKLNWCKEKHSKIMREQEELMAQKKNLKMSQNIKVEESSKLGKIKKS